MERLLGASTFCIFGEDAKISLAQIVLGRLSDCERTVVITSVSFEKRY